jgi:hypothetical protein
MLLLMIISYQSKPPVIPGRAKREPGIHNHDREYGFPDVLRPALRASRNDG